MHSSLWAFGPSPPLSPSNQDATYNSATDDPMQRDDAMYRPAGLLQGQDGSMYVSEDVKGRIWKISYKER